MRTLLICHDDVELHRHGLASWLASFSDLCGILELRERRVMRWRRLRRELRRSGALGVLDVVAFQAWYRIVQARSDAEWRARTFADLRARFGSVHPDVPVHTTATASAADAVSFVAGQRPELIVAFSKQLLKPALFSIPRHGTFVMHPGICPEYRNAHGCFWALVRRDLPRVGMTLLRIDEGIDTGPVFGYFSCAFDETRESHVRVQDRVVFDNLDAIRDRLLAIAQARAQRVDTSGRASAVWGQPRLSAYVKWQRAARRP